MMMAFFFMDDFGGFSRESSLLLGSWVFNCWTRNLPCSSCHTLQYYERCWVLLKSTLMIAREWMSWDKKRKKKIGEEEIFTQLRAIWPWWWLLLNMNKIIILLWVRERRRFIKSEKLLEFHIIISIQKIYMRGNSCSGNKKMCILMRL